MRHTIISCAVFLFAAFNCEAASLNLDESCKFKNKNGECITVIEKPKPDNNDIYCREYYEINGRTVDPLVFKEGKHLALAMEFPHMVAIGVPNKQNEIRWACGGILISKQHVLSSSTCLKGFNGEAKIVRLGDLNIHEDKAGPYRQDINIKQNFIHPDFIAGKHENDVGIALLEKPVDINPYAVPACLNTKAEIPLKELYSAAGFGDSKKNKQSNSKTLQKVIFNIIENKDCTEALPKIEIKDSLFICVGAPNTSTCQGDSGGPLQQINEKGVSVIYGIIAFGSTSCELANLPEVHTRVSKYVDWIKSIIE